MKPLGIPLALILGFTAAGCGGGGPVPAPVVKGPEQAQAAPTATPPKPPAPAAIAKQPEAASILPPLAYESKGRRDPFVPIQITREKVSGLDVSTVKLVGVIGSGRLLALVEAPDGLGYIVKPGDVLGNGRVTDVAPSSITFAVSGVEKKETSLTLRLVKE